MINYYALLYTLKATVDNPSSLMRVIDEPGNYTIERFSPPGKWVVDSNLAAHLFKGEPGAEPISASKAKLIQAELLRRYTSRNRGGE